MLPETAVPLPDSPRPRAGASSVSHGERIATIAVSLATEGGLEISEGVAELTRLFALPGNSLLLQLRSSHPSSRLTMAPNAGVGARLCLAGGFCCGAGHPPDVPETASCVVVLWARFDGDGEFVVDYAPDIQRFSLIANRRIVRSAAPLASDTAPLSVTLGNW